MRLSGDRKKSMTSASRIQLKSKTCISNTKQYEILTAWKFFYIGPLGHCFLLQLVFMNSIRRGQGHDNLLRSIHKRCQCHQFLETFDPFPTPPSPLVITFIKEVVYLTDLFPHSDWLMTSFMNDPLVGRSVGWSIGA